MKRSSIDTSTANTALIPALATIKVHPLSRFQRRAAAFRQPAEVGFFSYDASRALRVNCDSALKFFHPPPLDGMSNNLSSGFEDRYIVRASAIENLDSLLETLKATSDSQPSLLTANDRGDGRPRFCTWRGIMTKILTTPYSSDTWELRASLHKGTLYIMEDPLMSRASDGFSETDRGKKMTYWGYRFEGLSTLDHDPSTLHADALRAAEVDRVQHGVVDTHIQFCSVIKTRIGDHDIFMGAEVDCLMPCTDASSAKQPSESTSEPSTSPSATSKHRQHRYVELKTHRKIQSQSQNASFLKQKLFKTYFQCFLAGIPRIIVGFRDDQGFLTKLKEYKTLEIPRMARTELQREEGGAWDPSVCINFGEQVLSTLWKTLTQRNQELCQAGAVEGWQVVYSVRMKNGNASFNGRGAGSQSRGGARGSGRGGASGGKNVMLAVNEDAEVVISDGIIGDDNLIFVPKD
ncbi:decapping endonuclease targeting mRNA [Chytriomyces hyalinus]|nr:decapping endonuclease targeting mRNA [Chytriomyces hyalinus]